MQLLELIIPCFPCVFPVWFCSSCCCCLISHLSSFTLRVSNISWVLLNKSMNSEHSFCKHPCLVSDASNRYLCTLCTEIQLFHKNQNLPGSESSVPVCHFCWIITCSCLSIHPSIQPSIHFLPLIQVQVTGPATPHDLTVTSVMSFQHVWSCIC